MSFTLAIYPWVYISKYNRNKTWVEEYIEKPHKSPQDEAALGEPELNNLLLQRNSFTQLPLVNYTSQYGMGCFEGLKAFPQADGSLKIFRPDENAERMNQSMTGLKMPGLPRDMFQQAVRGVVRRNRELGYAPEYDKSWEKNHFIEGHAVYIRPFAYSEPAIGLGLSHNPWVVIVTTPVSAYFKPGNNAAVTTNKVRATPNGTGWIKCNANYVIPTLAKKEAEAAGYMEAVFLDAVEQTYVEEGSSCNIFFHMKDGTLVTPSLEDTVLPGITRKSIISLAGEVGVTVDERKVSIQEVLDNAREVFVTGTAAGVSHFGSITHKDRTVTFGDGSMGDFTLQMLKTLKGIQYGALEDNHGWMVDITD